MIGHVIMEIERDEICAAIQFYLNKSVFNTLSSDYHKATVTDVHQRSNGNFIIEFHGQPPKQTEIEDNNETKPQSSR